MVLAQLSMLAIGIPRLRLVTLGIGMENPNFKT